jgi:hypothetical protein
MKRLLILLVLISAIFSINEVVEVEKRDAFIGVSMEEIVDSYMESYPFTPSEFELNVDFDNLLDIFK